MGSEPAYVGLLAGGITDGASAAGPQSSPDSKSNANAANAASPVQSAGGPYHWDQHRRQYFDALLPGQTIEDRIPEQGSRRWQTIMKIYKSSDCSGAVVLPFYVPNPENKELQMPALLRSIHNPRRQDVVVKKYARGILQEGFCSIVSGQAIAIETKGSTFGMLAAASRCEAVYLAASMQPDNDFVTQAIEEGYPNVIVLRKDAPVDVLKWIKNCHNNYHIGSQTSFFELFMYVKEVECGWGQHKKERTITEASCPRSGNFRYEKLYEGYVLQTHKGMYKHWKHFVDSKAFVRKMVGLELWEEYRSHVETHCNFFSRSCDPATIAKVSNIIVTALYPSCDACPEPIVKFVIMELLRYTVPLEDTHPEFKFYANGLDASSYVSAGDQINWFKAPMGGNTAYKKLDMQLKQVAAAGEAASARVAKRQALSNEEVRELTDGGLWIGIDSKNEDAEEDAKEDAKEGQEGDKKDPLKAVKGSDEQKDAGKEGGDEKDKKDAAKGGDVQTDHTENEGDKEAPKEAKGSDDKNDEGKEGGDEKDKEDAAKGGDAHTDHTEPRKEAPKEAKGSDDKKDEIKGGDEEDKNDAAKRSDAQEGNVEGGPKKRARKEPKHDSKAAERSALKVARKVNEELSIKTVFKKGDKVMERDTLFMDDLWKTVSSPLMGLDESRWKTATLHRVLKVAVRFVLFKHVDFNGKLYDGPCSKLRRALQQDIVKAHLELLAASILGRSMAPQTSGGGNDDVDSAKSGHDMADDIIAELEARSSGTLIRRSPIVAEMFEAMREFHDNEYFILSVSHLQAMLKGPIAMRPNFLSISHAVGNELCANRTYTLKQVLDLIKQHLFSLFDETWGRFGKMCINFISADDDNAISAEDVSGGVFQSIQEIDYCFKQRVLYMLSLLDKLASGHGMVTDADYKEELHYIQTNLVDTAALQDLTQTIESWSWFWSETIMNVRRVIHSELQTKKDGKGEKCELPTANLMTHIFRGASSVTTTVVPNKKAHDSPPAQSQAESSAAHAAVAATEQVCSKAMDKGKGKKQKDTINAAKDYQMKPLLRIKQDIASHNPDMLDAVITHYVMKLETFIFESTLMGNSLSTYQQSAVSATGQERGHATLYGNNECIFKNSGIFSKNAEDSSSFCLVFYGNITTKASEGCLPLTSAFGKEFYLEAPAAKQRHFVPAWLVQSELAVLKQKLTPNCNVEQRTLRFSYSFTLAGREPQIITSNVKVFFLVPHPTKFSGCNVQLIRPMMRIWSSLHRNRRAPR